MNFFNEQALREIIQKGIQEEFKEYKDEINTIWEMLERIREEIITLKVLFRSKLKGG